MPAGCRLAVAAVGSSLAVVDPVDSSPVVVSGDAVMLASVVKYAIAGTTGMEQTELPSPHPASASLDSTHIWHSVAGGVKEYAMRQSWMCLYLNLLSHRPTRGTGSYGTKNKTAPSHENVAPTGGRRSVPGKTPE